MCTRNSGQSRRKRRICSRRQVCSAELRLMTMEEGTAVLESYTVVRTSGVANQDGRCLSVPSVRPMSWFDLAPFLDSPLLCPGFVPKLTEVRHDLPD